MLEPLIPTRAHYLNFALCSVPYKVPYGTICSLYVLTILRKANIDEERHKCESISFSLRHSVHHIHRRSTSVTLLLCSRKRGPIRLRLCPSAFRLLPFVELPVFFVCFTCTSIFVIKVISPSKQASFLKCQGKITKKTELKLN